MSITSDDNLNIKAIQAKSLSILYEIHNFCSEHKIRYFIIGGTLIGAVRHNGFVPWDDDIDIAMPRPDYEKFLKLAQLLPFPLEAQDPQNHTDYIYNYSKVYDTSTTAVEDYSKPFVRGLWVDIFPLDGTFENKTARKIHFYIIHRFSRLLMYRRKSYAKSGTILKRSVQTLHYLISLFFPQQLLVSTINKLANIKSFESSKYVGNLFGRWREKEVVDKKVFDESANYDFSGIKVIGPKDYHQWLSKVYGNYMKLPPIEQQKPDHSLLKLCLNKSYKSTEYRD
ncbi:hypothetical protein PS874_04488 [Pseudomonas fluorescens]|nr:hypothetical protein PS874_04488 [Pseudomonas fluorescens]